MADFAARVDALRGEVSENGGPVGGPCFVAFEMGIGDEFGDAEGELVDYGDGFGASHHDGVVPGTIREGGKNRRWTETYCGLACFCCGLPRRELGSLLCS